LLGCRRFRSSNAMYADRIHFVFQLNLELTNDGYIRSASPSRHPKEIHGTSTGSGLRRQHYPNTTPSTKERTKNDRKDSTHD